MAEVAVSKPANSVSKSEDFMLFVELKECKKIV